MKHLLRILYFLFSQELIKIFEISFFRREIILEMRVCLAHSLFLVIIGAGVVGPPGTATLDQNTAIFFCEP